LGANGALGGEITDALLARGWTIRALSRKPFARRADPRVVAVTGDAMDSASIRTAAEGADLIVHAVNPPGYRDWDKLVVQMLDNTIAAAQTCGARILLPGTVYNYGPDAGSIVNEDSPQHPVTRKGALRVRMEERLAEAAGAGVSSRLVRAGDFFGGRARASSWFAQGLIKMGQPLKSLTYPGQPGVGHAWAYLPDLAETMARLAEAPGAGFETYHFGGHWDHDGGQMIAAIRRAAGFPVPQRRFPWTALNLAAPFITMLREMQEMRYLWREPLRLDNAKLVGALGAEPHTPLDQAVARTLVELGCLPAQGRKAA
jgi:nucleoside-diphosphate-sugar epimerase